MTGRREVSDEETEQLSEDETSLEIVRREEEKGDHPGTGILSVVSRRQVGGVRSD